MGYVYCLAKWIIFMSSLEDMCIFMSIFVDSYFRR